MARGPKKHLKRIATPKSWMLGKTGGIYACRPSQGPHKLRESIPIHLLLRHKLGYANTGRECKVICADKEVNFKFDGKVRRDTGYPIGIMDILSIEKTGETYRVWYDVKGRVVLRPIKEEEAKYKLLKIIKKSVGPNKIPYITTHDSRTIRFPHQILKLVIPSNTITIIKKSLISVNLILAKLVSLLLETILEESV